MKLYISIILIFVTVNLFGQSSFFNNESLITFRDSECKTPKEKDIVDSFLFHRETNYLVNRIDTTTATRIKVQEIYDFKKKSYICIEDYFYDTLGYIGFYNKELYFTCDIRPTWKEKQFDTAKNRIAYFNPFPVTYVTGCGQVKHPRNEGKIISKLKKQTLAADSTEETYFVLNTIIDKKLNKINYQLFIPQKGKRQFCTDIWCIAESGSKLWD